MKLARGLGRLGRGRLGRGRPGPGGPAGPEPPTAAAGEVVYAIGDVHGRADLLDALLSRIADEEGPGGGYRLVLLGDYIDRGPDSRRVVERLSELLRGPGPRVAALKGNHEAMLLGFLEDPARGPAWAAAGAYETLRSYDVAPAAPPAGAQAWADASRRLAEALPPEHLALLQALPLTARSGDYLFVHAGVRPGRALEAQVEEDLLWIRKPFLNGPPSDAYVVVHGHTPTAGEPDLAPGRIGLDTGAYATGRLTALRLEGASQRFLQTGEGRGAGQSPA